MEVKILIGRGELAGSLERQKAAYETAAKDIEAQIKALDVVKVFTVTPYEAGHEFHLIAAVEVAAAKKGGK